jgi:hypothetical protein
MKNGLEKVYWISLYSKHKKLVMFHKKALYFDSSIKNESKQVYFSIPLVYMVEKAHMKLSSIIQMILAIFVVMKQWAGRKSME